MTNFITSTLRATCCAFALLFVSMSATQAQDDAISTYFSQYVNDKDFTVVFISGRMFDLMESVVSNLDTDDLSSEQVSALRDVVQDMRGLKILTTDRNGLARYNEAKARIVSAKPYETLMTVREKGDTFVDFYVREKDGVVDELLLLVGEGGTGTVGRLLGDEDDEIADRVSNSFTLLSFEGRIDLEKVGALSKAFNDDNSADDSDDDDDDDDDAGADNRL